jgi:hypothetical protein
MDDQAEQEYEDDISFWTERNFKESPDESWETYRKMARDIDSALHDAEVRKRMLAWTLLEEVLSAFGLECDLVREADKLQGEPRFKLTEALFKLFAKAGKKTPDEVLKQRVEKLLAEHVAARPRGGRRKKVSPLAPQIPE